MDSNEDLGPNIYVDIVGNPAHNNPPPAKKAHSESRQRYYDVKSKKKKSESNEVNLGASNPLSVQVQRCPYDIDLWKQYVSLQSDNIQGSIPKSVVERQIDIVTKALSLNPGNDELRDLWVSLIKSIFPVSEVSDMINDVIKSEPKNLHLYEVLIEVNQESAAHTSSDILLLYQQMISKCKYKSNILKNRANSVLRIFQKLCLYIQQTDRFDLLFKIVDCSMVANVGRHLPKAAFETDYRAIVLDLEEKVATSGLPIHELWYRMESLKESTQYEPLSEEEDTEVLQIEDIIDLVPLIKDDVKFVFLSILVTLFKIPILPARHCSLKLSGIVDKSWYLDSAEMLFGGFYISPIVQSSRLVKGLRDLFDDVHSGPQYWGSRAGQKAYLDYCRVIFKTMASLLQGQERKALQIWSLRFEYMLCILTKNKSTTNAKIKSLISDYDIQKKESLDLLAEYALLLTSMGKANKGAQVLHQALCEHRHAGITSEYLYATRVYVEILLTGIAMEHKIQSAIAALCAVTSDTFNLKVTSEILVQTEMFYDTQIKRHEMQPMATQINADLFLDNYHVHLTYCGAWFHLLTKANINAPLAYINKVSAHLNEQELESLYEWAATALQYASSNETFKTTLKKLYDFVCAGVVQYPSNMNILTAAAEFNTSWMDISMILNKTAFGTVVLSALAKVLSESSIDNIDSYKLRSLQTLGSVETSDEKGKSAILWKLYLKFLNVHSPEKLPTVLIKAIEKCPWNKALHIMGVKYDPQNFELYVDMIMEKDLKMHILLEELQTLRDEKIT